ncbi:hypothetical protein F0562_005003 [Nyssa sinensis]|uniref:Uncharacterized protein n=1 Tax=Nyssa sinensis TaxID=561372 RepID=A0A5J5AJ53_9ASTE|nr:hypothetical protein F0562_005003 [Nyssa sinensis]
MTSLQRSSVSFRRQGSSGRIWNDPFQFSEPKAGELHAFTPPASGKSQDNFHKKEEIAHSHPSAALLPAGSEGEVHPSITAAPPSRSENKEINEERNSMGGRGKVLSASIGAVSFMAFIWFLFVGVLSNWETKTTTVTIPSTSNPKLLKLIGTERHAVYRDLDLNYVSKRRVPNGPDPIHNRRAWNSRQLPGQA